MKLPYKIAVWGSMGSKLHPSSRYYRGLNNFNRVLGPIYNTVIIRNPQSSIGNYVGPYITQSAHCRQDRPLKGSEGEAASERPATAEPFARSKTLNPKA